MTKSIAERVASILSAVFSPLLVPTYGVIAALTLSVFSFLPASVRWTVILAAFISTCVLPMVAILVLWKMKVISEPGLNSRTERTIPYVITIVCYTACAIYLYMLKAPMWLWGFMAGGAIASIICLAVNFKWKISAHLAAMGGLIAVMIKMAVIDAAVYDMGWWIAASVFAAGLVGSSRVLLERHTVMQVIVGTLTGFICVYIF